MTTTEAEDRSKIIVYIDVLKLNIAVKFNYSA